MGGEVTGLVATKTDETPPFGTDKEASDRR